MLRAWLEFAACLAVIGFAGFRLTRYADAIAEKARLSASWTGLALLATVTSLPELMTGASAVTVASAPDIAVGDVLGSAVFNLFLLACVDLARRGPSLCAHASRGHRGRRCARRCCATRCSCSTPGRCIAPRHEPVRA
jgi:cation:H+ antiporter